MSWIGYVPADKLAQAEESARAECRRAVEAKERAAEERRCVQRARAEATASTIRAHNAEEQARMQSQRANEEKKQAERERKAAAQAKEKAHETASRAKDAEERAQKERQRANEEKEQAERERKAAAQAKEEAAANARRAEQAKEQAQTEKRRALEAHEIAKEERERAEEARARAEDEAKKSEEMRQKKESAEQEKQRLLDEKDEKQRRDETFMFVPSMSGENSESKAPSGDIHHSGDNHEVQMAHDEATDDGSSLGSSPYQSDEEIIMSLFAQGNDSTSSSDDQGPLHADFPSVGISRDERNLILDQTDLKRETDPGHRIFPHSTKMYLEPSLQNPSDKVDLISREIQNVLCQHVGWAYVAHHMAHTDKFECRKPPTMSICDVAIITATQPLHILTFVEDAGKQEHTVEYNAQLTRSIIGFIKKETGVSLDVIYGVVPASTWKDEKMFKEKLERLETVARRKALPGYLHMDNERYTAITKALVDLYSEQEVKTHPSTWSSPILTSVTPKLNQEQQERMYSERSKHDQNRRTLGPPIYGSSVKEMLAVLLMALMVAVIIKLCNLPPPA